MKTNEKGREPQRELASSKAYPIAHRNRSRSRNRGRGRSWKWNHLCQNKPGNFHESIPDTSDMVFSTDRQREFLLFSISLLASVH